MCFAVGVVVNFSLCLRSDMHAPVSTRKVNACCWMLKAMLIDGVVFPRYAVIGFNTSVLLLQEGLAVAVGHGAARLGGSVVDFGGLGNL